MKKLLVLVLALAAVLGMIFAVNVSAADAEKLTGLADVSKIYKADGSWIENGGMNGGSYISHLFDGGYGACYNNNVGSYIVTDLNAKLPGGYYVTEIKIFHSNNSKFSLYYSKDGGATWNTIVENAQVTEATYAVGDTATQVKYVFTTCANWVASAKEIEIYGIDPSELACTHENLSADAWTPIPGSATCTGVGKVSQTCPDCSEVLEQVSNDVLPLGHDLVTTITRPGTSVSYGAATLKCSRCEYTIDFSGEVNLTDMDRYCSIGESQQFTNVLVSSIADLWGASTVENMFKNDWENIGPFNTWVAAGEDDELEYVMLNFQGVIDLTKIKVMVQNDSGSTLVISALNEETGEYEVVRSLQSYDANIGGGQALVMEVPMLGVTTSSIKIQSFSNWRNTNGYYYNRMVIGELEAYGIAEGCGLDADNHECVYDIFVDYVVAPTCQAAGTATYKCACNATTVVAVEASEEFHNYVEVDGTRVNSTCTVAGYYTGKCSVCEAETTITLEFDVENGHSFTETSRTDADCTNAGSVEYKCDNCEATKTEEIPALGHKFGEAVVVNPTCKEAGSSTKTCEVCFYEDVTTLETTGCTWTLESIITEPTCGAAGEANYVCSVCGETKVDAVAATGAHVWDEENYDVITNPTCEGTGAATFTCTACGTTKKDVLSALGHDFSVEVEGTKIDPTCVAAGSVQVSCANGCGKEQTKTIEAIGHSWVETEDTVYETCTTDGTYVYMCENGCEETKTETVPARGHVWSETPEETTPATCVSKGAGKYFCTYCWIYDEERGEVEIDINPENHANMEFNEAYTFGTCPDCGAFSFYGTHEGVGDNELIWMFMGNQVNIYTADWSYDAYYTYTASYSEETGYTVTLASIAAGEYGYDETYNGSVATIVINENGTLLITLPTADSDLVFGKDPNVVEPENHLLNGTYAYSDMAGNLMIKLNFFNGTITVLEDNMGAGFPESFAYSYYPATGVIETPDAPLANFSVSDGVIYFGRGFVLTPVEDEPDEPDEPEVEVGDVIGSFTVKITDNNCWIDLYEYTATVAGQYSFYVPAGVGMWRAEYCDTWPAIEDDLVDYNFNPDGAFLTVDLAENETFSFYVASAEKDVEHDIEVYYLAPEHTCEYTETSRTESTCTVQGSVTYTCSCGESYTETLELAPHTEAIIPAVPGELRNPGMTSGVKCEVCDAVLVEPVKADGNFRFAAVSLALAENIGITYKVQVPEGFENVYVVFTMNGVETVVTEYAIEANTGRYMFVFNGIRLSYMADLVTATVYAEKDGVVSANSYSDYSVKSYIVSQLGKSTDAKLKTMLSDLLILGAKTQVYQNYKADQLMTDDVDASLLTASTYTDIPSSAFVQQMIINDEATRAIADWKAVSLVFTEAMALQFKLQIDPAQLENIEIKVTVPVYGGNDRVDTYTAEDLTYSPSENRYILLVENIKAAQYGQTVVGDIYCDGVQISRTVNYSVNSYLQKNKDNANVALRDFLRAAYLYGESVFAYAN